MIPRLRDRRTVISLVLVGLYACGGATGLEDGWDRASSRSHIPNSNAPVSGKGPGSTANPKAPTSVPPVAPTSGPTTPTPGPTVEPGTPRKCSLAIPPSKRFADLTEADYATLCEFLACSRGGYGSREIPCPKGTRVIAMPNSLAECVDEERTAALAAGSACELTMGMLDACYGPWGDDLCVQPGACKAIDAVAITCN